MEHMLSSIEKCEYIGPGLIQIYFAYSKRIQIPHRRKTIGLFLPLFVKQCLLHVMLSR